MTQGVLDLIQAIQTGDSEAIDAAFNAEMAERVAVRIDGMREGVAKSMFDEACGGYKKKMKKEEAVEEEVESEVSVTAEELEQLEAYMQSEEFNQLDEISKATLGSYVKKASSDLASSIHGERDAEENDDEDERKTQAKRAEKRMSGLETAGKKIAK